MMLDAAFALLAAAVIVSWFAKHRPRSGVPVAWALCCAAAVVLVVAGGRGLAGHRGAIGLGSLGGLGPADLRVDPLSGLFLVIAFGVAVPVLLANTTAAVADRPRLPATVAVTLAAVAVIVTADNLFVLLFGWETLTVGFYLLTGYDRTKAGRASASVVAVVFGKASGAALLIGGTVLAAHAGTFTLADLGRHASGAATQVGYALLLLGFAVKVGLLPIQVWLPPSYASAPPPARAVMAGVAVNVGFYGMWRTMQVLGAPPTWLVVIVLVLAGITAILGIAHAAVHADLAYLVAWSSVENAGVISAGYGVAMIGVEVHHPALVAAGLLAATAQVCAHALGKSLLYVATSAIEQDFGTTDLDRLRGIARRLPWTGTGLVIGAWTLAGLPLAAGFASEWLTLEALMQQFRVDRLPLQLATAVAGALVALTVGVASVTFVRLIGLTAFGPPQVHLHRPRLGSVERAPAHRAAVALLAGGCLGAAMVAPLEIRLIARGLAPLVGSSARGGLKGPWVLQPVYADFSALSPSWLWIAIPALMLITTAVAVLLSGRRMFRVRRVPAWSSASPGVERGVGYTSYGYANPMRKVLANLLMTKGELRREELRTGGQVGAEDQGVAGTRLGYTVDVIEVVEHYLYRPGAATVLALAQLVKRLQSGRLDAYMTYMLIALVAVLAVVSAVA
jgi:formate hydrogenlyase subunit 3/multisubunit Na+/H+ antiporter MnhD subunit